MAVTVPTGGHFLPRLRAATPIIACNGVSVSRFSPGVKGKIYASEKRGHPQASSQFGLSVNAIELQSQSALLVSCVILVQQALCGSLVDALHCNLVSALGLGAIAFNGSSLELFDSGLQCGALGLIAGITRLGHQNTLLSRLDIRQTKHLPDDQFCVSP